MKQKVRFAVRAALSAALIVTMLLALTACGEESTAEDTSAEAEESFVQYSCKEDSESKATVFIQLDINPSFIFGMTADGKVMSIEANNADAEDVLLRCLDGYFDDVTGGVELEYVIQDIGEAVQQSGYIEDTLDVSVTLLSGAAEGDTLEKAFENATAYLEEEKGITASIALVPEEGEEPAEGQAEVSEQEEDHTCDLCGGAGTIVCDLCNGEGTIVEIEEREVEVRNDYVCPYCGGVGILDDGMHNGETAVCGYCGGDGKTGSMSGEFREKAYDTQIVEEEVTRQCPRCNGSGNLSCSRCEGDGLID